MRGCAICVGLIIATGFMGCGSGLPPKAKLYPVKGKVTINGKPLTGCTLMLVSMKPTPGSDDSYIGKLNDSGQFELSSPSGKAGAAVGKYKVTFSTGAAEGVNKDPNEMYNAVLKGTAKTRAKELPFPKDFESALTSKKEVEITPESNELLIAI